MPRPIATELARCLDRANPYVEYAVEISAPDVGRVLQRADDQFLLSPDPQVSLSPAASLVAAPAGGIQLAPTVATLVDFTGASATGQIDINKEDPGRRVKGLMFQLDPSFDQAVLRRFSARLSQDAVVAAFPKFTLELQIYRAAALAGYLVDGLGHRTPFTRWDFAPLIPSGAVIKSDAITWAGGGPRTGTAVFDLTGLGLVLDASQEALPSNQFNGRATYYFSLRLIDGRDSNLHWLIDTGTARSVAGVGDFDQVFWARNDPSAQWSATTFGQAPSSKIEIETFAPSGGFATVVYKIDQRDATGTLRAPTAGTVGRIRFDRSTPRGSTLLLEISSTGSGGAYTAVADGDVVTPSQQTYHLRATLTPNASHRATPVLIAAGVEFRTVTDVSLEAQTGLRSRATSRCPSVPRRSGMGG
jgi:hypothetical protein